MASPSASSVTLSNWDSLDDESSMDIDEPLVLASDSEDDKFIHQDESNDFQRENSPTNAFSDTVLDQYLEIDEFVLPNHYTDPQFLGNQYTLSPCMRGAIDPDPRVLKAILSYGSKIYTEKIHTALAVQQQTTRSTSQQAPVFDFPVSDVSGHSGDFGPDSLRVVCGSKIGITTPLMEAIRAGLPENVSTLLQAGANPNGVPLQVMEDYSAFFLRFRPMIPGFTDEDGDVASRGVLLKCMDLPQISSITMEEVEDRFWDGIAPFWCEEAFTPTAFYHHGESMPSLVEAARSGTIDMFDMLLEAGADASFWMSPHFYVLDPPTESSLSVSSPLHAALQVRDNEMLKHLLDIDFDPNIMPLANPTRCFTPLMATIIYKENFNKDAFDLLCSYPETNSEVRTPIYGVHLLHFAVAALNVDMLKHVASVFPLKTAGKTALGHTLLHIVCMPSDALEVQRHSEIIYKSIHETRDLHARNDPYTHCPPDRGRDPIFDESRFAQQTAVVKYLWDNGITGVEQKDVHGNTPLHYLVGCRSVNHALLTWWLDQPGVDTIWRESLNYCEATPEEMFYSGERAQKEGANGWRPWFKRSWTKERVKRKQEIWRDLLGENARRRL